jgi:hypothetical protein
VWDKPLLFSKQSSSCKNCLCSELSEFPIPSPNLRFTTLWVGALQRACPFLNYTAKTFGAGPSHGTTCWNPAATGVPTLALGARAANNDMNSGLCWAAMVQFIFWREYLSSADKQEGVCGSFQVSLDLCTRTGCHIARLQAQEWNAMLSRPGFPSPLQREIRRVQQLSFWPVAISLRDVEQKLQWLWSFSRGFGSPEAFP